MKSAGLLNLKPAWLAASYAQLGNMEQARRAADEVLRLAKTTPAMPQDDDPRSWRRFWSRLNRFRDPKDLEHFSDGLRKAGLPV